MCTKAIIETLINLSEATLHLRGICIVGLVGLKVAISPLRNVGFFIRNRLNMCLRVGDDIPLWVEGGDQGSLFFFGTVERDCHDALVFSFKFDKL